MEDKKEKKTKKVSKNVKKDDVKTKKTVKEEKKNTTIKEKAKKEIKEEKKERKTKNTSKKEVVTKEKITQPIYTCELEKKDQKAYRVLSRIISVMAKILRVCAMILVPIIFVMMIIIPIAFKNVEVNGNIIKFNDARFILSDDYITANIGDKSYLLSDGIKNMNQIVKFLNDNSISKIVTSILLVLASIIVTLVISIYLLLYIERLFDNFYRKKTPFEEENAKYIRNIAKLMIISVITSVIFNVIISIVCRDVVNAGVKTYSITIILGLYVLYYIFKYAINMQNKVDTKICD